MSESDVQTADADATQPLSTRQRIVAAAEQALIAGGPGHLRVDRVAEQAAANKRMIYHYFGDRNGLVTAVYRLQFGRLRGAGPALSEGTHATLALMMSTDDTAEVVSGAIDPAGLQSAARILLPYLMQAPFTQKLDYVDDAGEGSEVTPRQWVSFCVEMMSLAFAGDAPVDFPHPPGSIAFQQVSERLLSREKPRYRIHSVSRSSGATYSRAT